MHLYSKRDFMRCKNHNPDVFPPLFRYKRAEDAKMALEQMDGFELAGRTVCGLVCLKIG